MFIECCDVRSASAAACPAAQKASLTERMKYSPEATAMRPPIRPTDAAECDLYAGTASNQL